MVWSDDRNGRQQLFFARLDQNGAKVGADILIDTGTPAATLPDLDWNGAGYGISFVEEAMPPASVRFVRIGADGARVGAPHRIGHGSGINSLVWNGQGYANAHHSGRNAAAGVDVFFSLLDQDGAPLGPEVDITNHAGNSFIPQLAWTGSIYGLIFVDSRNPAGTYFARVDALGAEILDEALIGPGGGSRIGTNGTSFAISWADSSTQAHVARIDNGGVRLGADVARPRAPSGISGLGSLYALTWVETASAGSAGGEVKLATLGVSDAALGPTIAISTGGRAAVNNVQIVASARGYALAWPDQRSGTGEIYFAIASPP
ncbi:MAG: hypothetical protein IT384_03765 [Deltaproteobacteria bacterium]|nr:hypothetical protein [Deltaproteobacteria bacterium]